MKTQQLTKLYMRAILIAGAICCAFALLNLPTATLDLYFVLLFAFTALVGSRITVKIPRVKTHIAASDTFVFLALLLYGGETAIILSAVDACFASWRFCRKKITVFFNAAAMALSTTAVVGVLHLLNLSDPAHLNSAENNVQKFFIALCVIALTQFLVNTFIATMHDVIKNSLPFWETWKNKYIWAFFSYFIGAAGAGMLVQISDSVGVGVIVATFPVTVFVFLTYRMYLRNVEISVKQAEQAQRYADRLKDQAAALRESEERFRSAFEYAPIGIGIATSTGQWLRVNRALCEILSYPGDELLGMNYQSLIYEKDLAITLSKTHELLTGITANYQTEQRFVDRNGRTVWTSLSVSSTTDGISDRPNLIFQVQDITDRKLAEAKLQHEATHDALTGLPNRTFFMEKLSRALNRMSAYADYRVSLLFIDLDRFKHVNDSLGHLIGDQLLIAISQRLRQCIRPADTVARLGGDEFTILVEGKFETEELIGIADRIQQRLGMPFDLSGNEVYSSASIGILHATHAHNNSEDMMRDADTAMYQAKRAGKARHAVFDEEMHRAARETLKLETDLRRAIEQDEINIVYQPIYTLETGQVESLEALARWDHPTFGRIPPDKFISLAEELGLIDKLSDQIFRKSCMQTRAIHSANPDRPPVSLSLNLSCRQFAQTSLVERIGSILEATGFPPSRLKLEITESVLFEYPEQAIEMLNELCGWGIEISVDDFGTGYSNLSYLLRLPIANLKIDRSFVRSIDQAGGTEEIVQAIVHLARNLKLRVVAEGVETPSQIAVLKRLECDAVQGFYYSEPLSYGVVKRALYRDEETEIPALPLDELPCITGIQ